MTEYDWWIVCSMWCRYMWCRYIMGCRKWRIVPLGPASNWMRLPLSPYTVTRTGGGLQWRKCWTQTPLRSSRPCIYEKLFVASLSNYLIKIKPPALSIKVKGRRLLFVPGQLYSREVLTPRSQILRLASLAPFLSVAFLCQKYAATRNWWSAR